MKLSLNKLLLLSILMGIGMLIVANEYDENKPSTGTEELMYLSAEEQMMIAEVEKAMVDAEKSVVSATEATSVHISSYEREHAVDKWLSTKSFWKIWSEKNKLDGSLQALDKILRVAQETCNNVPLYGSIQYPYTRSQQLKQIDMRLVNKICAWKPIVFSEDEKDQIFKLTKHLQELISKFNCLVKKLNRSIADKDCYNMSYHTNCLKSPTQAEYYQHIKSLDDIYKQIEDGVIEGKIIFDYAKKEFRYRIIKNIDKGSAILGVSVLGVIMMFSLIAASQNSIVQIFNDGLTAYGQSIHILGRSIYRFFQSLCSSVIK